MTIFKTPYVKVLVWSFIASSLVSGCAGNNFADGISVELTPGNDALIGPGPDSSCVDRTSFKRAALSGNAPTSVNKSVSSVLVAFSNFRLKWEKTDTLYVQAIRFTVSGPGISGDVYEGSLNPAEVEALLGVSEGTIPTATTIDSNADSRDSGTQSATTSFARCGLKIGGIPLVNGSKTSPFTATLTLEVIGTAIDGNSNRRFVRVKTKSRVKYYGS